MSRPITTILADQKVAQIADSAEAMLFACSQADKKTMAVRGDAPASIGRILDAPPVVAGEPLQGETRLTAR